MEQDLLSERTKNQRKSNKLNQDYRKTFNEVRLCTLRELNKSLNVVMFM